jgi:hypothetical protein
MKEHLITVEKEYALFLTSIVNIFDHAFSRDFELLTH